MRKDKILIIGDSISEGKLGWSYAHFLPKKLFGKHPVTNIAVQGHSVSDCVKDVTHYFDTENVRNYKAAIVMVGSIDLCVPYAINHCPGWEEALGKDTFHYAKSIEEFKQRYEELLKVVLTKFDKDHIIVMTIPPFELGLEAPYQLRHDYNNIIRGIVSDLQISHLINVGTLCNIKPAKGVFEQFDMDYFHHFKKEVFWTIHFPFTKNLYGFIRHLNLTVDGLHFNSFAAKRLASAVNQELKKF